MANPTYRHKQKNADDLDQRLENTFKGRFIFVVEVDRGNLKFPGVWRSPCLDTLHLDEYFLMLNVIHVRAKNAMKKMSRYAKHSP